MKCIFFILVSIFLVRFTNVSEVRAANVSMETSVSFTPRSAANSACNPSDSVPHWVFSLEYIYLKNTHEKVFRGGTFIASYQWKFLLAGLGTGYSYAPFHNDNNLNLFSLRMIPVFLDAKILICRKKIIVPFAQLSSGATFISYTREDSLYRYPQKIASVGWYVYGGVGVMLNFKRISPMAGIGFQGFHLSSNVWEINPHGLTKRVGLLIKF